eukprot:PhF_6_TR30564/c0_g1_i2/m.44904/K04487/iscS, NFS1; cysteine desulfurase
MHGVTALPHTSSVRWQKKSLDNARTLLARDMGVDLEGGGGVVFTSGGTEANNLAIVSAFRTLRDEGRGNHIITSNVEHPSVKEVMKHLETNEGAVVTYLPVDRCGHLTPQQVESALRRTTVLVSIMHANNEVGSIMPISEIGAICKKYKIPMHTDCAQTIGKIPVSVSALNVDLLSVCGHKFYGPKGSGALCCSPFGYDLLQQVTYGAGHESGRRPGTESTMLDNALAAAVHEACDNVKTRMEDITTLRNYLRDVLSQKCNESRLAVEFNNGVSALYLPNTVSVAIKDESPNAPIDVDTNTTYVKASDIVKGLGPVVAVSAGSACHSGSAHLSHVLTAMQLSPERSLATLRISIGWSTSKEEVEFAVKEIVRFIVGRRSVNKI